MSRWTHSICGICWKRPNDDRPIQVLGVSSVDRGPEQLCCFCGRKHHSGIVVRVDPERTICRGDTHKVVAAG